MELGLGLSPLLVRHGLQGQLIAGLLLQARKGSELWYYSREVICGTPESTPRPRPYALRVRVRGIGLGLRIGIGLASRLRPATPTQPYPANPLNSSLSPGKEVGAGRPSTSRQRCSAGTASTLVRPASIDTRSNRVLLACCPGLPRGEACCA